MCPCVCGSLCLRVSVCAYTEVYWAGISRGIYQHIYIFIHLTYMRMRMRVRVRVRLLVGVGMGVGVWSCVYTHKRRQS